MAETKELGLFAPPDKLAEYQEQQEAEREQRRKVKRRTVFRWLGWGSVLAFAGQMAAGFPWFYWPQKLGSFGGVVSAGNVSDYKVGDVKVMREGKFYITRVPEGFLALWWKCPHLGCTVPWKENDAAEGGPPGNGDLAFTDKGRFACPCHGSIYNRYGQIIKGPAPRPMDLFPLRIDGGKLLVDTGPTKAVSRASATAEQATPA